MTHGRVRSAPINIVIVPHAAMAATIPVFCSPEHAIQVATRLSSRPAAGIAEATGSATQARAVSVTGIGSRGRSVRR